MRDLVLFPNDNAAGVFKADPRFQNAMVFLVEDGPIPLEGIRFRQAWIELYCFQEEAYADCMNVIMQSIKMSSDNLPPILF